MPAVDDKVRALEQFQKGAAELCGPGQHRGVVALQIEARPVAREVEHQLRESKVMRQPLAERDVDPGLVVRSEVDRKALRNRSDLEIAVAIESLSEGLGRKRADEILQFNGNAAF